MTFIKDPSLLECWFCPCGDKEKNSCPGGGDGSCAETFYKFVFEEPKDIPRQGEIGNAE